MTATLITPFGIDTPQKTTLWILYYSDYEGDYVTGVFESPHFAKAKYQEIQNRVNPTKPKITWRKRRVKGVVYWNSSDGMNLDPITLNEEINA